MHKITVNKDALYHQDFMIWIRAIVADEYETYSRLAAASPSLVRERAAVGASRDTEGEYYFEEIKHYLYAGDTALHMAAAGFRWKIVQDLLNLGADCSAKNRRGAEPLHYASDANIWNSSAQVTTIECLIRAGANPNAVDKNGVTPLHRAVRTRSAAAVEALLASGAEPRLKNKSGSTPLHLAVQNTGRSESGTPHSLEQQRKIILVLLQRGASLKDRNSRGRTVEQIVTTGWIRELLKL